jgi:hypothetical protein
MLAGDHRTGPRWRPPNERDDVRGKSFNRGKHETTQAEAAVDWAQQATDMVDRRNAFSSERIDG